MEKCALLLSNFKKMSYSFIKRKEIVKEYKIDNHDELVFLLIN